VIGSFGLRRTILRAFGIVLIVGLAVAGFTLLT
jgi:hypothetical protein